MEHCRKVEVIPVWENTQSQSEPKELNEQIINLINEKFKNYITQSKTKVKPVSKPKISSVKKSIIKKKLKRKIIKERSVKKTN